MTPPDLTSLAERVERLTGPDREVDATIALLLGLRVVDEGHPLGRVCYNADGKSVLLPRYTASLDAARTLVSENWDWRVETFGEAGSAATVWRHGYHDDSFIRYDAATPALALCAAALRSRGEG